MGVSKKPKQSSRALVRQPIVDPELWMRINAAVQQIQLDAESFRNGTLLQDLAHQHHLNFNQFLSAHQGNLEGVVTWGSQCSGSEGTDFVISAAQQAFEKSGKGVVFQQKFACEVTEDKRKWIDLVINTKRRQKGEDPICIFCDIQHMGEATAKCWVHKTDCRVPDVNILVVSTSCKDLSRMSRQGKKGHEENKEPVLAADTSPGGSADTYRGGLLAYIDHHHVDLLLYENSEVLGDEREGQRMESRQTPVKDAVKDGITQSNMQSNHAVFEQDMVSRGFQGKTFVLNAKLFGLPQNRNRLRSAPRGPICSSIRNSIFIIYHLSGIRY
jgi:hypothetical protein